MENSLPRILVVDDEQAVVDLLAYNLRKAHYEVVTASNGRRALELARQEHPDLILLDLMLPGIDGLEVCRQLRALSRPEGAQTPIIMITARGEEVDRVVGLELGADDYVTKPFSMRELLARVKAVLRRAQARDESPSGQSEILAGPGGLRVDPSCREASAGAAKIELTRLEFDLLYSLLANRGRVMTREKLLEQVWGYDYSGDTRAVDSAVKRLRSRLRAADPLADGIEAVRGLGYKFQGEKP